MTIIIDTDSIVIKKIPRSIYGTQNNIDIIYEDGFELNMVIEFDNIGEMESFLSNLKFSLSRRLFYHSKWHWQDHLKFRPFGHDFGKTIIYGFHFYMKDILSVKEYFDKKEHALQGLHPTIGFTHNQD